MAKPKSVSLTFTLAELQAVSAGVKVLTKSFAALPANARILGVAGAAGATPYAVGISVPSATMPVIQSNVGSVPYNTLVVLNSANATGTTGTTDTRPVWSGAVVNCVFGLDDASVNLHDLTAGSTFTVTLTYIVVKP